MQESRYGTAVEEALTSELLQSGSGLGADNDQATRDGYRSMAAAAQAIDAAQHHAKRVPETWSESQ